ncbi:murein L,D-transpeptidase YcbB/YkuD [Sphingobium jiangsuense]|uniref:Murein L,D-transpeptidase YcbB/YkuD n=1 Tax=Sphingobium jiangsuense TaxID=870476 RepID=A0A7W6FN60_9SPHN|nr:murein L,D-transpeptidase YcbB/YkuD [Sphingobium jiangsuense]
MHFRFRPLPTAATLIAAVFSIAVSAQQMPAQPSSAPPVAPPPAIAPTAPALVPIPPLSSAQAALLTKWVKSIDAQGIGKAPLDGKSLPENALIEAVLDRAHALHNGRVAPADFLSIWALRPAAYDPRPGLARAVVEDRLQQWIDDQAPPYSGYEDLRQGLQTYRRIREAGGWPVLSAGAGESAIRQRLAIEDKTGAPGETLAAALQRAQRRYGLKPSGVLDAATLDALNVPVENRIASIMANMERWRWMPRDMPVNRVQVNIAAAVLTVFEGDRPVMSMRAVTGRPGNETPMLVSRIHSIVVNPPWNVPTSIARKELLPQGRQTLIKKGYRFIKTPDGGERLQQAPGPSNSLGRLKFDFDNPFAVYLHDTPARGKFASYDRLASHGCIRLEKPIPLAELMLRGNPDFSDDVQALIDTGKTQRLALSRQVSVYLLYWTAFAGNNGVMNFRNDPYGWDRLLAAKIEASRRTAQPAAAAASRES